MDERSWRECNEPQKMLEFLRGRASDRKLRLFAVGCCRRVWLQLDGASLPEAIKVAERFADGEVSRAERQLFHSQLGARGGYSALWAANCLEFAVLDDEAEIAADHALSHALKFAYLRVCHEASVEETYTAVANRATAAHDAEGPALSNLVREVFGNSLCLATIPSAVLAWNDGTITRIANAIYQEHSFEELGILADALLEAGCTDEEIQRHCRVEGPHVRGCWVLDALTGRS